MYISIKEFEVGLVGEGSPSIDGNSVAKQVAYSHDIQG
jgi:hypothetical protein